MLDNYICLIKQSVADVLQFIIQVQVIAGRCLAILKNTI